MGIPPELVQRSAAARAAADGVSVDDILAAWSGGEAAPAPEKPAEPEPDAAPSEEAPEAETAAEEEPAAAVAVIEEPVVVAPEPTSEPEPEEILEPVPLATRIKTAVRVGAWTGAGLGVVAFLVAGAFWAANTKALPDEGPVIQAGPTSLIVGVALVSIIFGTVVAGISRAVTAWSNPAMQLSGSRATTAWVGAAIGLVLGIVAGAMLNGFGTPVEGSDPALIQLPVLATLFVMVIGGAILGALTALVPQFLGVPVAVDESDTDEVETVKTRLGNALTIPLAGLLILGLLVLPFAFALIESNHLAPGVGGAVVAMVAAGGILGFAALAGNRPEMRISWGDMVWALLGIGTILLIVISVLFAIGGEEEEQSEEPAGGETAVVQLL
jgi:MFS family permease